MIVGICGTQVKDNVFEVEQIIMPVLPPYPERPLLEEDVYVIFATGFNIADPCTNLLSELGLFTCVLVNFISCFYIYFFNRVFRVLRNTLTR